MITGVWIKPGEDDLIVETKDEEEVEREVAVRMLTDVYEVPLKEPDPEP